MFFLIREFAVNANEIRTKCEKYCKFFTKILNFLRNLRLMANNEHSLSQLNLDSTIKKQILNYSGYYLGPHKSRDKTHKMKAIKYSEFFIFVTWSWPSRDHTVIIPWLSRLRNVRPMSVYRPRLVSTLLTPFSLLWQRPTFLIIKWSKTMK